MNFIRIKWWSRTALSKTWDRTTKQIIVVEHLEIRPKCELSKREGRTMKWYGLMSCAPAELCVSFEQFYASRNFYHMGLTWIKILWTFRCRQLGVGQHIKAQNGCCSLVSPRTSTPAKQSLKRSHLVNTGRATKQNR